MTTRTRTELAPGERDCVVEALRWVVSSGHACVHAFVVMPDHLHLLITPLAGKVLAKVMVSIKGFPARRILALRRERGHVWQDGYYESAIANPEEADAARRYIADNPVRAGLAASSIEYAWSSLHPSHQDWVDPG